MRHPIVIEARGFPVGEFVEVVADLAIERFEVDNDNATLTVRWFDGSLERVRMPAPSFRFIIAMLSVILDGTITSKNMLRVGVIFRSGLVPLSIFMNCIPSHHKTLLDSFGKQCLVFPPELDSD
jgi:hypothetical protein